ncbi:hypothetical protein LAD12857_15530 [Lacrimispora amygdalina]|uniref:Transposase n=1 Tax=Lacrimispora amygdalina TaxID=253257 RepID=A0ABQ5M540_9FIRM
MGNQVNNGEVAYNSIAICLRGILIRYRNKKQQKTRQAILLIKRLTNFVKTNRICSDPIKKEDR